MIDPATLPALLQLASPGLPIGGFSYSSGLEAAVDAGLIHDARSAHDWIAHALHSVWAPGDARIWPALHEAWAHHDADRIQDWNDRLIASRDTRELRLETLQSGRSLALWLLQLDTPGRLDAARRRSLEQVQPVALPTAHALASWSLGLDPPLGLYALGWSLLEAQVSAAVRLVPLGQTQGQQILRACGLRLPAAIDHARAAPPHEALTSTPMLSILSARHETQYSRLFRS